MVSLSVTKLNADEDIRKIDPIKRNCYFSNELQQVEFHNRYSQANCLFECALKFAQNLLKVKQNDSTICTPWFFPFHNKDQRMCNPWEKTDIMETIKSDVPEDECTKCLPGINFTIMFTDCFYGCRSQKHKNDSQVISVFLCFKDLHE